MKLFEFYELEHLEQEAVYQAVSNYIDKQNDEQKKTLNNLTESFNKNNELASNFSPNSNSPSFQFD